MEYKKSRQNAKRVISSAKEKKQKEWANDLNDSECQNEIRRYGISYKWNSSNVCTTFHSLSTGTARCIVPL